MAMMVLTANQRLCRGGWTRLQEAPSPAMSLPVEPDRSTIYSLRCPRLLLFVLILSRIILGFIEIRTSTSILPKTSSWLHLPLPIHITNNFYT
jgi:hypothetical protein